MFRHIIVLGGAWIGIAAAVWLTIVPASISVSTFGWVNAALAVVFVVALRSAWSARPASSIAELLYDVEHPVDIRG